MILKYSRSIFTGVLAYLGIASAQEIVLRADENSGRDKVWLKRYDAGKNSWGIVGNHIVTSGEIWFDAFPGETGSYKVTFGVVLEADGRPKYRISAGGRTLKQGSYPFASGTSCGTSASKPAVLDIGAHEIKKGEKIVVWGETTYECSIDHGAYTRWYELRFERLVTEPSQDKEPPTAPGNLRITSASSTAIDLAWDAAKDNTGVVGYDVFQGDNKVATVLGTKHAVSGLEPSTSYVFRVKAKDGAGNISGYSNQVSARTADPAPALKMTVPNGGEAYKVGQSVAIRWEADEHRVSDVLLHISADQGVTWLPLTADRSVTTTDKNWRNFTWIIPAQIRNSQGAMVSLISQKSLVRVSDYNDPSVRDVSDGTFQITASTTLFRGPWAKKREGPQAAAEYILPTHRGQYWSLDGRVRPIDPSMGRMDSKPEP